MSPLTWGFPAVLPTSSSSRQADRLGISPWCRQQTNLHAGTSPSKWLNHHKKKKKASLKNHQGSCWSYFISACSYQTCVPLWVSFTEFLLRKHLIAPPWCVPEFMEAMSASMHKLSLGDSFWFLGLQCFISGISRADWIPPIPTDWPFLSLHVVQSWIIGPRGDLHREVVSCTWWVVLFSPSTCCKPHPKIIPLFLSLPAGRLLRATCRTFHKYLTYVCGDQYPMLGPIQTLGFLGRQGAILKAQ